MYEFKIVYTVPDDDFEHVHSVKADSSLDAVTDLFEFEEYIKLVEILRDGEEVWPPPWGETNGK